MAKYTKEEIENIVHDYDNGEGMSYEELGKKCHRSPNAIASKLRALHIYRKNRYRYTEDDIIFLKKYYPIGDWNAIFKRFPNIDKSSIHSKMSQLGIKQIIQNTWTEKELCILKNNYTFGDVKKLCELLPGRSYKAITTKAKRIGLYTREFWTATEKDLLKEVYPNIPLNNVTKLFPNKNRNSIIKQAMNLNISSYDLNIWTDFEDSYIKDNWELLPDLVIAKNLHRTQKAVQARRLFLGIYRRDMNNNTYESLSKYIRGHIQQWKKDSMKACNYKCIFTGEKDFQIHHLYGVSNILNNIIKTNNFTVYNNVSDYSKEELNNITEAFLMEQSKYPLGVCISKNIHILFHSLYGQYYNTPEQWYQFEKDFRLGNYNNLLKSA